jgi:hypothetical protein
MEAHQERRDVIAAMEAGGAVAVIHVVRANCR